MAYIIRSMVTGEIAMVDQLGKVRAWFPDTSKHNAAEARIMRFTTREVAQHIATFNANDFSSDNRAIGHVLEVQIAE